MNAPASSPDLRIAAMLLAIGLVAMTSASVEVSATMHGDALYYFKHQSLFMAVGILLALFLARVPLEMHRRLAPWYGVISLVLLTLTLIPGLGYSANNSTRWLDLGPMRFQPSELIKPALVLWMAAYVAQHATLLETRFRGVLLPLGIVSLTVFLLLLQPDFGTACVIAATALCMLFLCGGYLRALLGCALCGTVAMGGLAVAAPYRLMRIQTFLDPWADPFDSGYQLTQSLIAIGSGGMWGRGLGDGVQKHFYLPEMHTDFVFAVAAEEFGLIGAMVIILLFAMFLTAAFRIARQAQAREQHFAAAVAYGVGLWISLQAFVNIAVNMGALPTKGLTLPLMSAGGSSMLATLAGLGLLWRARYEAETLPGSGRAKPRRGRAA